MQNQGLDFLMERVKMEVFDHSDNVPLFVQQLKFPSDRRIQSYGLDRRFIQHEAGGIGRRLSGKKSPFCPAMQAAGQSVIASVNRIDSMIP